MKSTLLAVHAQLNNYKLKILSLEQLKMPDQTALQTQIAELHRDRVA